MKAVPVTVNKRTGTGKGAARQLRAGGTVPAILYGEQTDPAALQLNRHEISTILHKSTSEQILVDLNLADNGGSTQLALVREVQHDPVTGDILHVDFLHISPTKKIRVTVPVHITGIADGVKNFGGILQHVTRDLMIEALPADIPEKIDVDSTSLGIGDAIHVRDIAVERLSVVTPGDRTIVSIVPPTVVKEVVTTAEAPVAGAAAGTPEVIGEKKPEGEEEPAKK
jgi:large subunit ribosomal protein L25